jgi:signal transduction histidine kinase
MQERANLLGARFVIDSTPGTGTRVLVEISLSETGIN